jgi:hypothetical protein
MKIRLPNDVLRQNRSTGKFEEKLARLDENQGVTFRPEFKNLEKERNLCTEKRLL